MTDGPPCCMCDKGREGRVRRDFCKYCEKYIEYIDMCAVCAANPNRDYVNPGKFYADHIDQHMKEREMAR